MIMVEQHDVYRKQMETLSTFAILHKGINTIYYSNNRHEYNNRNGT